MSDKETGLTNTFVVQQILQFALFIAKESGIEKVDFITINKLLYRFDTESYLNHGKPMMGLKYDNTPLGPMVQDIESLFGVLLSIEIIQQISRTYSPALTISSFLYSGEEAPKTTTLSDAERDLVEAITHAEMFQYSGQLIKEL